MNGVEFSEVVEMNGIFSVFKVEDKTELMYGCMTHSWSTVFVCWLQVSLSYAKLASFRTHVL